MLITVKKLLIATVDVLEGTPKILLYALVYKISSLFKFAFPIFSNS